MSHFDQRRMQRDKDVGFVPDVCISILVALFNNNSRRFFPHVHFALLAGPHTDHMQNQIKKKKNCITLH